MLSRLWWRVGWPLCRPFMLRVTHTALIFHTHDWQATAWLGAPIRQSVLDLWILQEAIATLRPALIVETGTCQGGSARFYAHLLDLLAIDGTVVTIDIDARVEVSHPRVQYLAGSSTSPGVVAQVRAVAAAAPGPVLVILDSDHSTDHVAREMEIYGPMVTPGSWLVVQDGVIDQLSVFKAQRPGPLPAIHAFVAQHPEFQIDSRQTERFLLTHHPDGWLRRVG